MIAASAIAAVSPIDDRGSVVGFGFGASGRYGSQWNGGQDEIAAWDSPVAAATIVAADPNVGVGIAVIMWEPETEMTEMTNRLTLWALEMRRRARQPLSSTSWLAVSALALALPLLVASPVAAQRSVGVEGGFVDARDFTGVTAMGFLEARSLIFFARGAVDVGFGPEDSGVAKEGDTCREVGSGQAVNDSRCTTLDGGVTVRAGVQFPIQARQLQLGLGYRFGESQTGVVGSGSLRFPTNSGWWGLTLEVGDEIVRASAGIAWNIGRSEIRR